MKHVCLPPLLLACCLPWLCADDFTVDWHRIGHGGGTSVNDEFTVSGVIGEAVAGVVSEADEFSVAGGFGVIVVLPAEEAPPLAISSAEDGTVVIYWPLPDTGWELRFSSAPDAMVWELPPEPLEEDGGFHFISVAPSVSTRFYRLFAVDDSVGDQDRDGIPDEREAEFGFDPMLADSDGDGVLDGLEDADDDGLPNAWELRYDFNPFAQDSDGNGIGDADEDPDGDRLSNRLEAEAGSNPTIRDTDGDGFNDEAEVTAGSDPLEFRNRPRPFAVNVNPADVLRPAVQLISAVVVADAVSPDVLRLDTLRSGTVIVGQPGLDLLRWSLPSTGQAGPLFLGQPKVTVEQP